MPKPVPAAKPGKNVKMREVCVELGKLNHSSGTQQCLSSTEQDRGLTADQPSTTVRMTWPKDCSPPPFCSSGRIPPQRLSQIPGLVTSCPGHSDRPRALRWVKHALGDSGCHAWTWVMLGGPRCSVCPDWPGRGMVSEVAVSGPGGCRQPSWVGLVLRPGWS